MSQPRRASSLPAPSFLDFLDRIAVINLPERLDRRREMESTLSQAGISPQDPRLLFFPAIRATAVGDWPSLGAHGCFLSHYNVLREARARGDRSVLILEDDCQFTDVPAETRAALLNSLAVRPWGIAYFGHAVPLHDAPPGSWCTADPRQPFLLAHCYAVNATVFDKLISFLEVIQSRHGGHPEGGPQHYDGALNTFRKLNPEVVTLLAQPVLAIQRSSRSDVTPGWRDRVPLLRQALGLARRLKHLLRKRYP